MVNCDSETLDDAAVMGNICDTIRPLRDRLKNGESVRVHDKIHPSIGKNFDDLEDFDSWLKQRYPGLNLNC